MASPNFQQQNFDYFLVLDFEATCEKDTRIEPQEVIEFPVLKVNATTFEVESIFHTYVQPKVRKTLTPFCTELTGITQDKVDGQPCLEDVLQMFHNWMESEGLLRSDVKSIFVTCGDWDLKTMLPQQSRYFSFTYPEYFYRWINIKKTFQYFFHLNVRGDLKEMLQYLNLELVGRHHSGIDDVKNIARVLKTVAARGCVFQANGFLK